MLRRIGSLLLIIALAGCDFGTGEAGFCLLEPSPGAFLGIAESESNQPLSGSATIEEGCGSGFCYWSVNLQQEAGWRIWIPHYGSRYSREIPPPLTTGTYSQEEAPGPVGVVHEDGGYIVEQWRLDFRQTGTGRYQGEFRIHIRPSSANTNPQAVSMLEGCFSVSEE